MFNLKFQSISVSVWIILFSLFKIRYSNEFGVFQLFNLFRTFKNTAEGVLFIFIIQWLYSKKLVQSIRKYSEPNFLIQFDDRKCSFSLQFSSLLI